MRSFFCFILCLVISTSVFAQKNTDEQLANQFFQNKEYDKASIYFEKLYDKKGDDLIFKNYLTSLLGLKYYEKAEKLCKTIGIINHGRIVRIGDKKQILQDKSLEEIFLETTGGE